MSFQNFRNKSSNAGDYLLRTGPTGNEDTHSVFDNLHLEIADTETKRQQLFRLRYQAYLAEGAINPRENCSFSDIYDDLDTSILFVVLDDSGQAVGSLRFSVEPPISRTPPQLPKSCPELNMYPKIISVLMKDSRPIASGSRFSVMPNYKYRTSVAMLLMLAQTYAAKAIGSKWGIATARGSHLSFYKRLLKMDVIGTAKLMPELNYSYNLLVVNLDLTYQGGIKKFPKPLLAWFQKENENWERRIISSLNKIEGSKKWLPQ